jgi:hypothetical protein
VPILIDRILVKEEQLQVSEEVSPGVMDEVLEFDRQNNDIKSED